MSSLVLSWSEWPRDPSSFILRSWGLCYNGLLGAPDHVSLGHAQAVRHLPYGSANWETDRCKMVTLQVHLACLRPNTDRMVQVDHWPSRCFLRLTWFKTEGQFKTCHRCGDMLLSRAYDIIQSYNVIQRTAQGLQSGDLGTLSIRFMG